MLIYFLSTVYTPCLSLILRLMCGLILFISEQLDYGFSLKDVLLSAQLKLTSFLSKFAYPSIGNNIEKSVLFSNWETADRIEARFSLNNRPKRAENKSD